MKYKMYFLLRKCLRFAIRVYKPSISRTARITKYIDKNMKGIEVAPYHSPIAPKKDGFNCLSMDIFDTETLLKNAKVDPYEDLSDRIHRIESVDIVSSAVDIEEAINARGELGSFDYIISSHNFEHLPNPIKFLQGCGAVLKPGGVLSMAIPNRRKTFDFARPVSTTTDFLYAYHENQQQPSPYNVFDFRSSYVAGFPDQLQYSNQLTEAYDELKTALKDSNPAYKDCHVMVFTLQSFLLIITECILLKLIPFSILEIEDNNEFEFYVHLKNTGYNQSSESINHHLMNRAKIAARAFR